MVPRLRRQPLLLMVLLLAPACDRLSRLAGPASPMRSCKATVPATLAAPNWPTVQPRQTSAEEDALIDQVVSMFPGAAGRDLCAVLMDPRADVTRVSNHPQAQAILD